jgi:HAD superfamily hydrolase (TIGR01484 family)
MKPIRDFPWDQLKGVRFLLTDIDDTLTEDGRLPASSLAAIERLDHAGIRVVPITGRPAGWCDHIARMWTVQGVVGENGAFYFAYDRNKRQMNQIFVKDEQERKQDRLKLDQIKERVLREIPGAGIASDQEFRIADLAIDFCEDVAPLSGDEIRRIVQIFEEAGATAKISSIHVNGWFGSYDKLTMTRRCLRDLFDVDIDKDNQQIAFMGDSPNDVPMFSFFQNSVGVANIRDFKLRSTPKWITEKRSARGFAEFSELLLRARS